MTRVFTVASRRGVVTLMTRQRGAAVPECLCLGLCLIDGPSFRSKRAIRIVLKPMWQRVRIDHSILFDTRQIWAIWALISASLLMPVAATQALTLPLHALQGQKKR
jgi:hypothetical protein